MLEEVHKGIADHLLDVGLHLGIHQFDLGLAFKLRVWVFDADNCRKAFPCVVTREVRVGILEQAVLTGIIVDCAGQRDAQPGQVGAAIDGVDGVGKGVHGFRVGIGVLDSHFHAYIIDFLFHVHHIMEGVAIAVEVFNKG